MCVWWLGGWAKNIGAVLILPYSSSIVLKALVDAHNAGIEFRVIVVDSRPKMEGQ